MTSTASGPALRLSSTAFVTLAGHAAGEIPINEVFDLTPVDHVAGPGDYSSGSALHVAHEEALVLGTLPVVPSGVAAAHAASWPRYLRPGSAASPTSVTLLVAPARPRTARGARWTIPRSPRRTCRTSRRPFPAPCADLDNGLEHDRLLAEACAVDASFRRLVLIVIPGKHGVLAAGTRRRSRAEQTRRRRDRFATGIFVKELAINSTRAVPPLAAMSR